MCLLPLFPLFLISVLRFTTSFVIFSPTIIQKTRKYSGSQLQTTTTNQLDQLLNCAQLVSPDIKLLKDQGFCNSLYNIREGEKEYVAKLFSPMALRRRPTSSFLQIDLLASEYGIGPRVLHSTKNSILMERLDGIHLDEDIIYPKNTNNNTQNVNSILQNIAKRLRQLHSLPIEMKKSPNMLWYSLDAMLKDSASKELYDEYKYQKSIITSLKLPPASMVCGHGDFKVSNIIYNTSRNNDNNNNNDIIKNNNDNDDSVHFIDFELSGPNYRGFDIAKLFRKNGPRDKVNQEVFIEKYVNYGNGNNDDTQLLLLESTVFNPLTWFEAAVFFDYASRQDNSEGYTNDSNRKWNEQQYRDRISSYDNSLRNFDASVGSLRKYLSQR